MLPFTRQQFLALFADYNAAIWPLQPGAYLLGILAIALVVRPTAVSDRIAAGILAAMWIWTGVAYHWLFLSSITNAAHLFGALFVLQGACLIYAGVWRQRLHFGIGSGPAAVIGAALVVYAVVVYPLVGWWAGHGYPEMPMFGVTPCPVTIFTLGMLLLTSMPVSRWLLIIPVIWSLIGGSAAFLLGVPQDWILLISGATAVVLIVARDRSPGTQTRTA